MSTNYISLVLVGVAVLVSSCIKTSPIAVVDNRTALEI